jgi:glutathione-independent formaldehyde dehydrogenase
MVSMSQVDLDLLVVRRGHDHGVHDAERRDDRRARNVSCTVQVQAIHLCESPRTRTTERNSIMKALVYNGTRDVSVKTVTDAKIEDSHDVIVKIMTTNICGSDLHMYEGRTDLEPGRILGHENMGTVAECGKAVTKLKVGDWVSLPFNIGCGHCRNCEHGLTAFCLTMNPPFAGAAYGFADMGPYDGGQAQYLRVPFADWNCLKLPEDAADRQTDYVMLSDIFPTGWHCTELARMKPGDAVVVFGAGPVGLMAAYSAMIKGADKVMIVDRHPDRLALAEKIGVIAIDDTNGDHVDRILQETKGRGADAGCECVGYQAHDPQGHERPDMVLNDLVKSVKATGGIGVVGIYLPADPNGPDPLEQEGKLAFDFGAFWIKGQSIATGQANVKAYDRQLRDLISAGRANPSWIVSHELSLDEAPTGYKNFDERNLGWTKVCLHP